MSRVLQENFSKFANWTGACELLYEPSHQANRRTVGQDGLVVMRWDFWLMVNGVVTGCVQQAKCSQQDFADEVSKAKQHQGRTIDVTPTDYLQLAELADLQTCRTDLQNR